MEEAVVVSAVRPPTGSFGGHFTDISVRDPGAQAVKPALAQVGPHGAGVDCADVDCAIRGRFMPRPIRRGELVIDEAKMTFWGCAPSANPSEPKEIEHEQW